MKSLFSDHINVSARVMDLELKRQNIVATNLANMKTPGYKALRFKFEKQLQAELELDKQQRMTTTNSNHLPNDFNPANFKGDWHKPLEFKPEPIRGKDKVDLDKEMVIQGKTAMRYQTLATVLKKNFSGLKGIIMKGAK
jgi:flagellar basal-body rod protein FlgB